MRRPSRSPSAKPRPDGRFAVSHHRRDATRTTRVPLPRRWRAAGSLSFVAACFLFLKGDSCSKKEITDPDVPVASVTLNADTIRVAPGATVTVQAEALDASNAYIAGRTASWASSNPTIASIAGTGGYQATLTALAIGTTTVTGTVSGVAGKTVVIVATPTIPVARVTLLVPTISLRPLDTASNGAYAYDASNNQLSGRVFDWRVADPTVATVVPTPSGGAQFIGLKVGSTSVTVTSEGKSATGTINVAGAPAPAIIKATPDTLRIDLGGSASVTIGAYDRIGGPLPDSVIAVSISDPTIAQFSPTSTTTVTGRAPLRVTGLALGTTKIRAVTIAGSLDIPVIVRVAPAARVTISPKTANVVAGRTATFTATAADASGAPYKGTIAFSAVATGATVTPAGVLTATQPGNVLVIASADALADTARVTVLGIDSVRVAPRPTLAMTSGGSASLTARAYAGGQVVSNSAFTWTSSNAQIVDVVPSNDVAVIGAKSAGTAMIIATSGGKADTLTVTVTAAPANTAVIHPLGVFSMKRLADGTTQTFNNIFIAGDHDATGDKSIQAMASYLFTGLPSNATIDAAKLTVTLDPQVTGAPFGLGSLMVELASGSTLNEGALATNAIVVATGITPNQVVVDVTPLIRAARTAGQQSALLRFRFTTLVNNNNQIDYVEFTADPLTVTYSVPGGVRATR